MHSSWFLQLLLLILSTSNCFFFTVQSIPVLFHMKEELSVNSILGNIFHKLPIQVSKQAKIINTNTKFFEVLSTGEIKVNQIIDRETLCGVHLECCGTESSCVLKADIFVSDPNSGDPVPKTVEISVHVSDENDQKPSFTQEYQIVKISESSPVGSPIRLETAIDLDVTQPNQIMRYNLDEDTQTFKLDKHNTNMATNLIMRVSRPLDYETLRNYTGVLTACDPQFCLEQILHILIIDENDHSPVFEQTDYTIDVPEDFLPFKEILQIKAKDKDEGDNAIITYALHGTHDPDLLKTFQLNSSTGSIVLLKKLSIKVRARYLIQVIAKDHGKPQERTSDTIARVTIRVEDVNDNEPIIAVISPEGPLRVKENQPVSVIATLRVQDADTGKNAEFVCDLEPSSSQLLRLNKKSNELFLLESTQTFDYEVSDSHSVTVRCTDAGVPAKISRKVLSVSVLDVNEYKPRFDRPIYEASVYENSAAGVPLLEVRATDQDRGAKLRYQLDDIGAQYFTLVGETGRVETSITPLDREQVEQFTFTVHVMDSDVDAQRSSCLVKVTVLDHNDNSPVFQTLPNYQVRENQQRFTLLDGTLVATDRDSGRNARVQFFLLSTWSVSSSSDNSRGGGGGSLQRLPNNYFRVSERGEIDTTAILDREKHSSFLLEIKATDSGAQPKSTLANVTIEVLDENDESPRWITPHMNHNVFNISLSTPPGAIVFTCLAQDDDEGENGRITYHLDSSLRASETSGGPPLDFFSLNATTGELFVKRQLQPLSFLLHLTAIDQGQPTQSSKMRMTIHVLGEDMSQMNFTVIVVMISLTALISLILLVAIVCVRRKPAAYSSRNENHSNMMKPKQAMQTWNYMPGQEMMYTTAGPSNLAGGTMSMNTLDGMAMPGGGYAMDDPMGGAPDMNSMQMHSMGAPQHPFYFNGNRMPLELDRDSGDSGRGGSEINDEFHQNISQFATMDNYIKGTRGFGTLSRPCASGTPLPGMYHRGGTLTRTSRLMSPIPTPYMSCAPPHSQCYMLPEDAGYDVGVDISSAGGQQFNNNRSNNSVDTINNGLSPMHLPNSLIHRSLANYDPTESIPLMTPATAHRHNNEFSVQLDPPQTVGSTFSPTIITKQQQQQQQQNGGSHLAHSPTDEELH